MTMSSISSSPLSVCWRSGKQTLSNRFIEPNSAPSWNRTPNFLRISKRSSSAMFGTDSPWTSTSPSSGYSRPTMCLMHTDLPVPDGPRIIEILPSGMPMFRPRRILLRPNALWTSTNSTASGTPVGRWCGRCASGTRRRGRRRAWPARVALELRVALLGRRLRVAPAALAVGLAGAAGGSAGCVGCARLLRGSVSGAPRLLGRRRRRPCAKKRPMSSPFNLRSGRVGWRPRTAASPASR